MHDLPDFTPGYEVDDYGDITGELLAINIHGHGIDLDLIEQLLDYERDDLYDPDDAGAWSVREDWLRVVPMRDGMRHVYGPPGRGARPVTVVESWHQWPYWCLNHPYEPAKIGIPAGQIVDGEAIVAARLAELAEQDDPRPDVEDSRMGGYIYMCRDCADDVHERLRTARREAVAKRQDGQEGAMHDG
ncbi:MAG: hypothetical protein IPJ61_17700 [Tessaracoccus sp.]|uniref:hypothetical protein n=1 Tax=Tessaracoccus sp. TaxID=1971211 RepID=UPI001EC61BC4|nr:hypothetical protein [Tessaracoccus sp.]MBK7822839.1 hypothetical protein [Tessaracoccus sp.]